MRLLWMLVGFAQAAVGVVVGGYGYVGRLPFVPHVENDITAGLQMEIHGAASFWYFLVATPLGWLALWLFIEGLLRVLAAAAGEPFGTLPVVAARAAWSLRPRKRLPDDLVMTAPGGLVIESARDYDWGPLTTVEVDGKHYTVTREPGTVERPHRYRLGPPDPTHVIRAITRYRLTRP